MYQEFVVSRFDFPGLSEANPMPVDVADARWPTDLRLTAPCVLWTQTVPRPKVWCSYVTCFV